MEVWSPPMAGDRYEFRGELWEYDGPAAWHFVSLPPEVAEDIREQVAPNASAFGSIAVEATVGSTRWKPRCFLTRPGGRICCPSRRMSGTPRILRRGTSCS